MKVLADLPLSINKNLVNCVNKYVLENITKLQNCAKYLIALLKYPKITYLSNFKIRLVFRANTNQSENMSLYHSYVYISPSFFHTNKIFQYILTAIQTEEQEKNRQIEPERENIE